MNTKFNAPPRIMIVDDEESVRQMFDEVLAGENPELQELKSNVLGLENDLFGSGKTQPQTKKYDLTYCRQGKEAVDRVAAAQREGWPFAMIFMDMRLPPGANGLWAAEKIRDLDQEVIIVFVTAYSDVEPEKISAQVKPADKLFYIQKPVHPQEVRQFADSLTNLWLENRKTKESIDSLERNFLEYDNSLAKGKSLLSAAINHYLTIQEKLKAKEGELVESIVAMKVLAKNIAFDGVDAEEKFRELARNLSCNVWELTGPFFAKLEKSGLNSEQLEYLQILRKNLENVVSPALHSRPSAGELSLTPSELQVANLVKQGKSTKDIARILNLGERTVEFHRNNIREKIGIKNKRASLKTYLLAIK